jgi:GMP synthase-like glutamine amidotransferase
VAEIKRIKQKTADMRMNILVCDWFEGLLPDFVPTFPHLFYRLFDPVSPHLSYKLFDVQKGEFPDGLKQDELYIISGSRAGAYEDIPWVKAVLEFIRRGYNENIKMAGVCFGHQAIAQALGGKVEPSPKGWGAGARRSKITHPKALRFFPGGELCLYYNHNDQAVTLPPMAERIATSDFCENEAFIIGDNILCFQGHPEYTKEYMEHVIETANVSRDIKKRCTESLKEKAMNEEVAVMLHAL